METNSHSIELVQPTDKAQINPCNHFSIRGYVAAMRQKNWKKTSPFLKDESEEKPSHSLPQLIAPKFRNWRCDLCVEEVKAEANSKKEQRNLNSNEVQEAPMSNSTCPKKGLDLNEPIDLDSDDDPIPSNNEKQNDAPVVIGRIRVHKTTSLENIFAQEVPNVPSSEECPSPMQRLVLTKKRAGSEECVVPNMEAESSLEINLNHEVPINPSLEVCPDPIQEVMHTIEGGSEVNVASNMKLDAINLNNMDKSSSEARSEGRLVSEVIITREAEAVAEDNVIEHTTEQFPLEPMADEVNGSARNMDNNVENDYVVDHHPKRFILKSRRKQRKMRLLDEIFRQNDEANTKQNAVETQSPSNVPSQAMSTIPDKVVIVEAKKKVTKRGRGRKRKSLPMAKKCKDADVPLKRVETEVQNIKRNAAKGKGKVIIESNKELDNDKMVEDSFALKDVENVPNIPVSTAFPPALNGEGLQERIHLAANSPSSGLVCNNRSSRRPEFQLPLPWPFQEGTSTWRPIRRGGGINLFGQQNYPSKRSTGATSTKGKGVLIKEIDEDRTNDVSAECSEPCSMKNFIDLTQEDDDNESDHHSVDDIIMEDAEITNQFSADEAEVAKIMATSLPADPVLENSPQMENPEEIIEEGTNGITTRVENNVIPRNRDPTNCHSFGNPFGLNNLYSIDLPSRFELLPSNGVYISPTKDTNNNFVFSQTSWVNWGISSSPNPTLHVHKHDNNPTFQIDSSKPMSLNKAFFRYDDKLKKIVSHPSSNTKDMTSPPSDSMVQQDKKLEIDLNKPCSDDITEPETLNENIDAEILSKTSVEASPNQRQSFDLNSTEPTPNMNNDSLILHPARKKSSPPSEMQRRILYAGQRSNAKLDNGNGSSKEPFDGGNAVVPLNDGNRSMFGNGKINGSASAPFMQHSKLSGWLDCETETLLSVPLNTTVIENSCEINKNPADFSVPEPGNPYMNDDGGGEEEEEEEEEGGVAAETNAPNKRRASTSKLGGSMKRKRNSKKR